MSGQQGDSYHNEVQPNPPGGPIVDSHVHLWDVQQLRYPWLEHLPLLNRSFTLEHLHLATQGLGISSMVFVQCDAVPEDCEREVAWVARLAEQEPRLQACVAWAPLEQGAAVRTVLDRLASYPLVRGVRRILQAESDPEFCLRPSFIAGLRCLKDFGWSFDLCINQRQLPAAIALAEQVPEIGIILDHIGKPAIKDGQFEEWAAQLHRLAAFPHVCCKISGVATEADHQNWTATQLRPYIDCAMEAFGFDRVLFGGDWPVATLAIGYAQWISLLHNALRGVRADEQEKFWYRNAARMYRLPL